MDNFPKSKRRQLYAQEENILLGVSCTTKSHCTASIWSIHKRTQIIKNLQISSFFNLHTFCRMFHSINFAWWHRPWKAAKFHLLKNTATNEFDSRESCLYFSFVRFDAVVIHSLKSCNNMVKNSNLHWYTIIIMDVQIMN